MTENPDREPKANDLRARVDDLYRSDSRRILASLIGLLGDFDLAEEALQEAFAAAAQQWPAQGVPANPRAWLVSVGRFRVIDGLRRRARFDAALRPLAEAFGGESTDPAAMELDDISDERLRLIFTCCHPALPDDARVALTLRTVCGLTTEEIARAYLTRAPTISQRIVRAKARIREARLPYEVPTAAELPERLDAVLNVIYLVFNEGYSATAGSVVVRHDLAGEAIRLGRLLVELLPEPEVLGLLALMLLHDSRRAARTAADGRLVLLEEQDRSLWDRVQIAEGIAIVERAFATRRIGPYTLQAAIAALHAEAPSAASTDWGEIAALYAILARVEPTPVVRLNQAVAVAMRDGPAAGLALIDALLTGGALADYQLAHAARAELCRRLGRFDEARAAYALALGLARQDAEREFLRARLESLPGQG